MLCKVPSHPHPHPHPHPTAQQPPRLTLPHPTPPYHTLPQVFNDEAGARQSTPLVFDMPALPQPEVPGVAAAEVA